MKSQKVIALLLSTALSISTCMPLGNITALGAETGATVQTVEVQEEASDSAENAESPQEESQEKDSSEAEAAEQAAEEANDSASETLPEDGREESAEEKRKPKKTKMTRIPMKAMPPFLHRRQNHRKQTPPQLKKRQILPPQKILHLLQTQQIRTKPKAVLQSPVKQILSEMMQ